MNIQKLIELNVLIKSKNHAVKGNAPALTAALIGSIIKSDTTIIAYKAKYEMPNFTLLLTENIIIPPIFTN